MYMRKYDMIIFKYEITRSEVYRRVRQCEKIKEISIEQADKMCIRDRYWYVFYGTGISKYYQII